MYSQLCLEFDGRTVIDFDDASMWRGPEYAYRIRQEYEDETSIGDRLDRLLAQPQADRIAAIIIGAWSGASEGEGAETIVERLVGAAPHLHGLRALYFGEMTAEECEISWINQTDVAPVLRTFSNLERLRIRGSTGLKLSTVGHERLRELAVECGGLPRSFLRELALSDFPALEHLELFLGEPHYGFDGGVEDLQPLLSGKLFPKLKFLGLMDSQIANEVAAVVVNSPIVGRIETLDLSMGNLDNEGVRALMGLGKEQNLKLLNISHHYATADEVHKLQANAPFEVIADDPQEPEDEWRPILHAE